MKRMKRVLAMIGALILLGMYLAVFILGLTASPATEGVLMAALACTVILPCLLYGMMIVARALDRRKPEDEPDSKEKDSF